MYEESKKNKTSKKNAKYINKSIKHKHIKEGGWGEGKTGKGDQLCDCYCCSVAQSCLTPWDSMDCSTPGFLVLLYLPEFAQTHVH